MISSTCVVSLQCPALRDGVLLVFCSMRRLVQILCVISVFQDKYFDKFPNQFLLKCIEISYPPPSKFYFPSGRMTFTN